MTAPIASPGTLDVSPTVRAVVVLPQPLRFDADRPSDVERRCGNVGRNDSLHLLPPLDSVLGRSDKPSFVPLSTRAGLPLCRAKVAELVSAPASHMVAPDRELDEVTAAGATLPARSLRELDDSRIFRSGAALRRQVLGSLAVSTGAVPTLRTRETGGGRCRGAEESRAGGTMTIDPILGPKFDRLLVEQCY